MAIDILNIEENKVKPGLAGKIITIAGLPKIGKSTFASKAEKPLFISTEPGLGLLPGVKIAPSNSWTEYKQILKQLRTDEAKAMYSTIVIDTVGNLWEQCAKFIWLQKNDGSDLSDYTIGMQQNKSMPEFSAGITELAKEGYTLILITHNVAKDVPNELGFKYGTEIMIDLPKRPRAFIFGLCDLLINVITEPTENGPDRAIMYLRQTTHNGIKVEAGGRYPNIAESAPFNYEELVRIIKEEDKKMIENGVDMGETKTPIQKIVEPTFRKWEEVDKDIKKTIKIVSEKTNAGDPEIGEKAKKIIASYLGENNKITEANASQQELVEAALTELKILVADK